MDWIKSQVVLSHHDRPRQTWSTPLEYWLCSLGYAVGYGSIWRFPYLLFSNGGGAFVIAYLFCFFFVGIPLFYWESAIGQMTQKGLIASYLAIHPKFKGIGLAGIIISFIVSSYYNLLLGFSWNYLFYSFSYPLPWSGENSTAPQFSISKTNMSGSIDQFNGINSTVFWSYLFSLVICFLAIAKGISITGKLAYVTAIGPYVLIIILMLRGLFLDGAGSGLAYIFTFEWHALFKLEVWYKAAAQVLFQLSLVVGTLTTFASYKNKNESIIKSSIGIPVLTALTGFLCAITVFCYMGDLPVVKGLNIPIQKLPLAGPDLVFVAYPLAVLLMPFPNFWSILFFLSLVFLGIDTQFAIMENVSGYLEEEDIKLFGHRLTPLVLRLFVTIGCFVVGFVLLTRAGLYWLEFLDTYSATGPLLLLCVIEAFLLGFHPAIEKFKRQIWIETQETVPAYFTPALKYISTTFSTFILVYAYLDLLAKLFDLPFWIALLGVLLLLVPVAVVLQAYMKHKDDEIVDKQMNSVPLIELKLVQHHEK